MNDEGSFFINDWTRTLYFIGRASVLRTENLPHGSVRRDVLIRYGISSPTPPVPFVYEPNHGWNIHAIYERQPGQWEIYVMTSQDASPTVYCFNTHSSAASGWGMIVWDGNGIATFDSRRRPMQLRGVGRVEIPPLIWNSFRETSHGVSGLSKPAMHASAADFWTEYSFFSGDTLFRAPSISINRTSIFSEWSPAALYDEEVTPQQYVPAGFDAPIIDGADYD
ncbi:hypothetical protein [Thioalkalivibrio sp. ARh3]|uniref:hypothetical protein n=1 Tax=Thioalkalivibrio sp. ARh3 TaxID=1158148 RepID=UPI0012DCB0AB|nr:hypothetical protein [Thioalkalivibrio sp. ARh3]